MVVNAPHIHLVLNHLPILGFGFGLLLLLWGHWRSSEETSRAALALFLLVGLTSILVFFSGHSAEDLVEGLAGVSNDAIHEHEEAGELAMIVSVIAGLLSGGGLLLFRGRPLPRWFFRTVVVGAVVAFVALSFAALQGGMIHHQEIRP